MRGILIDPENKAVTEIEHSGGYVELRAIIGDTISPVCLVPQNPDTGRGETMYVDDNGMLKDPEFFFTLCGRGPFAGVGVILGLDGDGDDISTLADLDLTRKHVEFKRLKITGWTDTVEEPEADMPWGGKGFSITMPQPIFMDRDEWESQQQQDDPTIDNRITSDRSEL